MRIEIGREYVDAAGRRLRVTGHDLIRDRVEGVLENGRFYSCSAEIFREVWLERTPPVSPSE